MKNSLFCMYKLRGSCQLHGPRSRTFRHINARAPYPSLTPNHSPGRKLEMFVRNTWVRVIDMTQIAVLISWYRKLVNFL